MTFMITLFHTLFHVGVGKIAFFVSQVNQILSAIKGGCRMANRKRMEIMYIP